MSLVGSLEDLGLGDILQIVHLSRKSGTLWIRSDAGEGQVDLLRRPDLRRLHEGRARRSARPPRRRRRVPPAELDAASEEARARGLPLERGARRAGPRGAEALEELRRRHVEDAVHPDVHLVVGRVQLRDPGPLARTRARTSSCPPG